MKIGSFKIGVKKEQEFTKNKYPEILRTHQDSDGRVISIELAGGKSFTFSEFMDLFKKRLRTIVAGEVISWDDYWRYQKQISPKAMEVHLDVVEAEARTSALKMPTLSRGQKIAIGTIILLFFMGILGLAFMRSMGLL